MTVETDNRVVLPKNVKPTHYELEFEPILDPEEGQEPSFTGSVSISLDVLEETDTIILNVKELAVKNTSICTGDVCMPATTVDLDESKETATFKFGNPLPVGEHKFEAEFSGVLNAKMMGFYRSQYKDPNDKEKTKFMGVTQFEATDARMAFPCFDEPNIKATFNVTMTAPETYDCLSNMPIVEETKLSDGKKKVKFDKTPIMSTYLLAFIVGELDRISGETADGVKVNVYTEKGSTELGAFALDCGIKTLEFYHKFFEIAYPLPKLDMVAIPDFAAGAMENWGLVTYRETALLLDPEHSSAQAKSRVAEVVAHELAHQWFGNLVTMDWWTHLWLNEGFATWAADLAVDTLFPKWKVWVSFVSTTLAGALRLDGLRSSHAIEVEVNDASEVNEIFDAISYLKGASVIRMLANYIGVDVFKQGLITYLREFSYSNAYTQDLWQHLEVASGKPIKKLMGNWTKQVGYPVLEVSENEDGILSVTQTRFLQNGSSDDSMPQWMVPIGVLTPSGQRYHLLEETTGNLTHISTKSEEWIKLNSLQSGVFRVTYPMTMVEKLVGPIRNKVLGPEDRLSLLMDSVALAKAGKEPTVSALEIMQAFSDETEYTCMLDLCVSLSEITALFGNANPVLRPAFEKFIQQLLTPLSEKLGWEAEEGELHIQSLLRSLIIGTLVEANYKPVLDQAVKHFKSFTEEEAPLSPDLRLPCYNAAVKVLGKEGYEAVLKIYESSDLNEEKVRCIRSLGASTDTALLKRTLEWGVAEVKAQDIFYVFFTVAKNRLGKEMAWAFLQEHWEALVERFGKGSSFMTRFLESCTKDFYSEEKAVEVETFFNTATKVGITRTLEQCLESIRLRAAWLGRDGEAVAEWIGKFSK